LFHCQFCGQKFEVESEKYCHLAVHPEVPKIIRDNLSEYPAIRRLVGINAPSLYNTGKGAHQFFGVVLNAREPQYATKLNRFNFFLGRYEYTYQREDSKCFRRKTLSDFFSFFSELELMHGLTKTLGYPPYVPSQTAERSVDFVIPDENVAIELKTPLETTDSFRCYVLAPENQKQLADRREQIKLLAIDTTYRYPQFPIVLGELELNTSSWSDTAWNCILTFDTSHSRFGYFFKKEVSERGRMKITQIAKQMGSLYETRE